MACQAQGAKPREPLREGALGTLLSHDGHFVRAARH